MLVASIISFFIPPFIGWLFDEGHPDPDSPEGRKYYAGTVSDLLT